MDQTLRMRQIRTAVTEISPYYGMLFLGLEFIPDPRVDTALVDGTHLWYNPNFFNDLPFSQACGVLAHEAHHVGAGHPYRLGDREIELFNYACDYQTNIEILDAGFQLPEGALIDYRFRDMSVERIYNILDLDRERQQDNGKSQDKQKPSEGQGRGQQGSGQPDSNNPNQGGGGNQPGQPGQGKGKPQPGGVDDGGGDDGHGGYSKLDVGGTGAILPPRDDQGKTLSKQAQDQARYEWEVKATHAKMVSDRMERDGIGKTPGGAKTIIKEIRRSNIDWREPLREFMRAVAADDYSWMRPDRRLITPMPGHSKGLYVPSLYSERMGGMVFACDTSLSMSQRMLQLVANEFTAVLDEVRPEFVDAVFCDVIIQHTQRFEVDDYPISLEFPGRRGTCVAPVFEWVEQQDYTPACMIYFTDLEVNDFPEIEPDYPVLWASTKHEKAPWGEILKLNEI